ncbi:MAG: DNA alkylation repair protein [Candidatus Methanomethylophilaceae archaeon]|nr:DNA alkylation repair protein [Candidatus Methanomethylophilaceae archaeon]
MEIRGRLIAESDPKYREFSSKLTPGCETILGVRMPVLRKISKEIIKGDWRTFLSEPGPYVHEEKILRGLVIAGAKMDMKERLAHLEEFIPLIDNWAVCDSMVIKRDREDMEQLWNFILPYFDRPGEYEKRFAVTTMLRFIDDEHIDRILQELERVEHDGYYLKMGVAWTLSFCFIEFPEKTLSMLRNGRLDDFTYNKTLQKITESLRVDPETKKMIKGLRRG